MTEFLVGAAVGIIGTVVGWLLSVLTEARNRRKRAKLAARMIFFELGVNLGVAANMADGDRDPSFKTMLSRSAWDQYAGDLAYGATNEVVTTLAMIYSTYFARLLTHLSSAAKDLSDEWQDDAKAGVDLIRAAVRQVGAVAGESSSQIDHYLAPFNAAT